MNTLYDRPGEQVYARGQFDLRRVGTHFYMLFRRVIVIDGDGEKVRRYHLDQIFEVREDAIDYTVQSVREQGEWPQVETPNPPHLEVVP